MEGGGSTRGGNGRELYRIGERDSLARVALALALPRPEVREAGVIGGVQVGGGEGDGGDGRPRMGLSTSRPARLVPLTCQPSALRPSFVSFSGNAWCTRTAQYSCRSFVDRLGPR